MNKQSTPYSALIERLDSALSFGTTGRDALPNLLKDCKAALESVRSERGLNIPEEIFEWILHMDLHLTEHDDRHRLMAYKAAWPHISKWLQAQRSERKRDG